MFVRLVYERQVFSEKRKIQVNKGDKICHTSGPPALSNLPCVIGRTPGFLLGTGRD